MERNKHLKNASLLLALLLIAVLGSGCTREDWNDLIDIGRAWAAANNVLDPDGAPNWAAVGRVALGISTGDKNLDAVIDSGQAPADFTKAEELSKEASSSHDITKVDEAIKIRPKDYGYRDQRGAMLFFQGKDTEADKEYEAADNLSSNTDSATYVRNLNLRANYLRSEMDEYDRDYGFYRNVTPQERWERGQKYDAKMAQIYKELYDTTGDVRYNEYYKTYSHQRK